MVKKEFTKFQIASFKRTAQNVAPLVRRKEKISAEIQKLQEELESLQNQIEAYQGPVREATGGFTTEDIIVREVSVSGTDKKGNPIKVTSYKLKYPDTVVPVVENAPTGVPPTDMPGSPEPEIGNAFNSFITEEV